MQRPERLTLGAPIPGTFLVNPETTLWLLAKESSQKVLHQWRETGNLLNCSALVTWSPANNFMVPKVQETCKRSRRTPKKNYRPNQFHFRFSQEENAPLPMTGYRYSKAKRENEKERGIGEAKESHDSGGETLGSCMINGWVMTWAGKQPRRLRYNLEVHKGERPVGKWPPWDTQRPTRVRPPGERRATVTQSSAAALLSKRIRA